LGVQGIAFATPVGSSTNVIAVDNACGPQGGHCIVGDNGGWDIHAWGDGGGFDVLADEGSTGGVPKGTHADSGNGGGGELIQAEGDNGGFGVLADEGNTGGGPKG